MIETSIWRVLTKVDEFLRRSLTTLLRYHRHLFPPEVHWILASRRPGFPVCCMLIVLFYIEMHKGIAGSDQTTRDEKCFGLSGVALRHHRGSICNSSTRR